MTVVPEAVFGIIVGCKLLGSGHVQQGGDGVDSVTGCLLLPTPCQLKAPAHEPRSASVPHPRAETLQYC